MFRLLKSKKLILSAAAVICAAAAATVAVSVTYAAYRSQVLGNTSQTVAGAIADYVRGRAVRNLTEEIKIETSDATGGIVISDLSPGDIFDYSFYINGFRQTAEGYQFNKVRLMITCEFSFTYAYPVQDSGGEVIIEQTSLSAVENVGGSGEASVQFISGFDTSQMQIMQAAEAQSAGDVTYRDPDAGTDWRVSQHYTQGKYVQKFGFYLPPVTAEDEEGAQNSFAFRVLLPSRNVGSGLEDYSEQFRLSVNMKVTAEQVLETSFGTTG